MGVNCRIALILLIVICPQIGACTETKSSYLIQDTALHSETALEFVWLDDHRLRFYGYRDAEPIAGDIHNRRRHIGIGYYIWDTKTNAIVTDPSLDGAMRLCVQGDYVTFLRKSPTAEKQSLLVIRDKGHETVTPLVNVEWFNRFSCRYYNEKPEWIIPNHQTLPLLDHHGFLDWSFSETPTPTRNQPLRFHPNNSSDSIALPIGTREVWRVDVRYASFKNSYFLHPIAYIDAQTGKEEPIGPWPKGKPVPVWWLAPDGGVTTETIPYVSFMRGGSRSFFPVREGIFITTHKANEVGEPGEAGGYLFRNGRVSKLITGMLDNVSISPNGCRVALIHDPYDTINWADRFNRINVKVLNVCQEDFHAR